MNTLVLVNGVCPYSEAAAQLIPVSEAHPQVLLDREAAQALARLMDELGGWGRITPVSGWRSRAEQEEIYTSSMAENGKEFTAQFVALPGHSEHQTGLAIDLGLACENMDFIRPDFPYSGICQAFRTRSAEFGFIERYPAGKEGVTGIAHEPWHFRYVGAPHARRMAAEGLTLEEYHVLLAGGANGAG